MWCCASISVVHSLELCLWSGFRLSNEHITPSAHQPSLAARIRTYLFQTGSYDVIVPSMEPLCLRSFFTRTADIKSRRRLRSSTSHRLDVPPVRLCTVGRRAFPVSGATVWNDLPLHVASAPSLAVFRQRLQRPFCFPVPTKTLSYDSCVTITIHHYCLETRGPCNN